MPVFQVARVLLVECAAELPRLSMLVDDLKLSPVNNAHYSEHKRQLPDSQCY